MGITLHIFSRRKTALATTVFTVLAGFATSSIQAQESFEREQLALILTQLGNAQKIVAHANAHITPSTTDRFWFDYERLDSDLQKIQRGIEHYLTPHRAQPRELHEEATASSYTRDKRELNQSEAASK